jgi:hypothetical protein
MKYKFDYITLTDPTFTVTEGNTVGEFVTIWVNVGGMFDWMLGAMPIDADRDAWVAEQLKQYEQP